MSRILREKQLTGVQMSQLLWTNRDALVVLALATLLLLVTKA